MDSRGPRLTKNHTQLNRSGQVRSGNLSSNFHSRSSQISGVRRSLVVTFAAIRLRGPRFKTRPGQKLEMRFLLRAHAMLSLWDHNIGYQSQSQAWKLTISK